MKIILLFLFMLSAMFSLTAQEPLVDILRDELRVEMQGLAGEKIAPYYMSYRVEDTYEHKVTGSMGAVVQSVSVPTRALTVQVRVGSPAYDNFHQVQNLRQQSARAYLLPSENSEMAIRQVLWQASQEEYRNASGRYALLMADRQKAADDTVMDYCQQLPYRYVEKQLPEAKRKFDRKKWEERVRQWSAAFKEYPHIDEGMVDVSYRVERRYFVSSDSVVVVDNLTYAHLTISVWTVADDGMDLPLYLNYFAYEPDDLPGTQVIEKDIRRLAEKAERLRNAPVIEPYTAPAILSSAASGIFFHEIFGHRVEAQRMKNPLDARTFYGMLNNMVLPSEFSVYDDPTLRTFKGQGLNGWYRHDDEGVKGSKVTLVDKGILKDFLSTRTPISKFPRSNGHGRAQAGFYPTSRQSNLIIENERKYTDAELRQMLIEEAKRQGKEYGFYLAAVNGGFTNTTTVSPNSFNVTPTEVYRVYVDGRPDELVRGVTLVGTPLSMFALIVCGGDKPEVFTGMCGAESGKVPVTAISPALFVSKIEFQKKGQNSSGVTPVLPRHY